MAMGGIASARIGVSEGRFPLPSPHSARRLRLFATAVRRPTPSAYTLRFRSCISRTLGSYTQDEGIRQVMGHVV